jgi:outer membrane protein TolC
MKKYIVVFFYLCILGNTAIAQKISLSQAIQIALENHLDLKNQSLEVKITELENQKLNARWLPQISANADFRWNTQLQTTVLPFDITGQNPEGQTKTQIGLPFNNTLGVQLDQKILDFNQKIDRKINNQQIKNRQNILEQQKIKIKQAVTEAYYQAIFYQEKIDFAQRQLARYQVDKESAETKFKSGTLLESDLDRYLLDVSNAQIVYQKAQQDFKLSLEALKYQMNSQENFTEVADNLTNILNSANENYQILTEKRTEIRGEEINAQLNELNAKKQKFKNLPSVSAYANYSVLQLSEQFNPFQSDSWFPFNYIGLQIKVPIFDGRQAHLSSKEYLFRQQINRNNMAKYKLEFDYEAKNAFNQLTQAKLDINETKKNVDLAQEILRRDKLRYEKGTLTLADLKNSEFSLQNAENNYLTKIYDFLVANIRYKKAIGNL